MYDIFSDPEEKCIGHSPNVISELYKNYQNKKITFNYQISNINEKAQTNVILSENTKNLG